MNFSEDNLTECQQLCLETGYLHPNTLDINYCSAAHTAATLATYDSYPYNRMGGMSAYPPPGAGGMGGPPVSMGHTPGGLGSAKASMPYSVNGVSLTSSGVDLLHPAMGYPSECKENLDSLSFLS